MWWIVGASPTRIISHCTNIRPLRDGKRDRNIEESNVLGTFESPDFKYRYQNGGAWFDMVWFRVYQNVFSVNGHNFRHDFPTNAFENHFAHANCMTTRWNFETERKVVIFTHLMKIPRKTNREDWISNKFNCNESNNLFLWQLKMA